MSSRFAYETVMFDVDGTLIDSNAAHAESWVQALREAGVPASVAQIRPLIGMGGDKLLPLVAHVDEHSARGKAVTHRKKDVFAALLPGLRPTPGARALVDFLKHQGVQLIIATSADEREMTALLKQAGLDDLFDLRTSKDDGANSKPDPDIVRAALARANARPESTVLIGDTPYDIEAAERAGIAAITLRSGGHWQDHDLSRAILVFDDPADLLEHWHVDSAVVHSSS